ALRAVGRSSKAESWARVAVQVEIAFGSAARSVLMAVRMKMRSPQTIGDALPRPGMATFHLTFFVVDHSVGGFPLGATPVASGPRHWGQLSSFCSPTSAAFSPRTVKHRIAPT